MTLNDRVARFAADKAQAVGAERAFLWLPPASDWPNWLAAGCGKIDREAYLARLEAVERQLAVGGYSSVRWRGTPAEVITELERLGLENTAENRAAAITMLGSRP